MTRSDNINLIIRCSYSDQSDFNQVTLLLDLVV